MSFLSLVQVISKNSSGVTPPPAGIFIAGGNRNEVPYVTGTATTSFVRQSIISVWSPAASGLRNPTLLYVNFAAQANGGEATTGVNPFNLKCAIEYPLGTRYRMFAPSGNIEALVNPGQNITYSLAASIDIPLGTQYWVRTWQEYLNPSGNPLNGATFNPLLNQLIAPGRNEGAKNGTDNTQDQTVVGTITAAGSINQVYGPLLVKGVSF